MGKHTPRRHRLLVESLESRLLLSAVSTEQALVGNLSAPVAVSANADALDGQITATRRYRVEAFAAEGYTAAASQSLNAAAAQKFFDRIRGRYKPYSTSTVPTAPSGLVATASSSTQVALTWADNSNNETGFRIQRKVGATGTYVQIALTGAGVTSFTDTTAVAGTTYYYRVCATNKAGNSAWTNEASITTPVPAPAPTPAPTPSPTPTTPVSVVTRNLTSLSQLVITGTSGDDSILVTQSGSTITINANGTTSSYTGGWAQIVISASAGNDSVTIDASVTLGTFVYGGSGNDTIVDHGSGKNVIVTIGGGYDTVTGNGLNTSYWVDQVGVDTVNASSAEINAGRVHRVGGFYQPFTTDPSSPDYVSKELLGQNLKDPTDSGATTRLTSNSLFGLGPKMTGVNQGQVGDCYFLAVLQSLAGSAPDRLQEMAVDLGDGTYAVQFVKSGTPTFVRLDGDLPLAGWGGLLYNRPGADGDQWASIMEKAFAYIRTGANTYASISSGWMGDVFNIFGVANTTINVTTYTGSQLYNLFGSDLAAGKGVTIATNSSITGGAPVIANHAYSVVGVSYDASGNPLFTLRNPWGVDGAGSDSNVNDGLVTLTLSQLQSNFRYGSLMA